MPDTDRTAPLVLIGILAALSFIIGMLALSQAILPRRIAAARQFLLVDHFDRERARLSLTEKDAVLLQIFDVNYNNTITITFDAETGALHLTDATGATHPIGPAPAPGAP